MSCPCCSWNAWKTENGPKRRLGKKKTLSWRGRLESVEQKGEAEDDEEMGDFTDDMSWVPEETAEEA